MTGLLLTSVELGLLYALVALGVFLTFRILNFPDLTVDGSLVTGAAAATIAIYAGVPGGWAVLIGFLAGFAGGSITAFLHIQLGISKILSGILALSMLYTINLRLMHGPNLALLSQSTILGWFQTPMNHIYVVIFLLIVAFAAKFGIDWFLQTEFGLWVRSTGDNEATAQSFAVNTKLAKFIGVGLSNGLIGMAGALIAQYQGFVDVNMGVGTIILGLAALMLGESFFSARRISAITWAIIAGSILYQLIVSIALRLGLAGSDLKLVTALIVIITIAISERERYLAHGKAIFNN